MAPAVRRWAGNGGPRNHCDKCDGPRYRPAPRPDRHSVAYLSDRDVADVRRKGDRALLRYAGSATGACAVCGESHYGQLAAGAPADFIVIDYQRLASDIPPELDEPFRTFFTRARAEHIAAVFAAGKEIVRDGKVLGIDEDALRRELGRQLEHAVPEIAALKPLLDRYQRGLARFYRASDHSPQT